MSEYTVYQNGQPVTVKADDVRIEEDNLLTFYDLPHDGSSERLVHAFNEWETLQTVTLQND